MSLRTLRIIILSIYVTLKISVITLFEVMRNRYRREVGDDRLRWWSQKLLELAQADCQVVNPHQFEFEAGKPYIVMCNHSSLYDIPLTFLGLSGSIRMLAKKELFKVPVWGKAMTAGEFISIDRQNRQKAFQDLEVAKKKMESGIILWVAPEGTRSPTGDLLPFKKGGFRLALQMGATILPIGIRGARLIHGKGSWDVNPGKTVEIHIGNPIDTTQFKPTDYPELMELVETQIRELAGVKSSS